jgi:hypothetical protein
MKRPWTAAREIARGLVEAEIFRLKIQGEEILQLGVSNRSNVFLPCPRHQGRLVPQKDTTLQIGTRVVKRYLYQIIYSDLT